MVIKSGATLFQQEQTAEPNYGPSQKTWGFLTPLYINEKENLWSGNDAIHKSKSNKRLLTIVVKTLYILPPHI